MAIKTKEQIKAYLNQCGDLNYNEFIDFIDSVLFADGGLDIAPICQVSRYKRFRNVNQIITIDNLFNTDNSLIVIYVKRLSVPNFEISIGTTPNGSEITTNKIEDPLTSIECTYLFDSPTRLYISGFDVDNVADVIVLYNSFLCDDNGEISMSLLEQIQEEIDSLKSLVLINNTGFQEQINALSNSLIQIPAGVIVQWDGLLIDIPIGWQRYIGNGGLFVIGENNEYPTGATGGEKSVSLTSNQNGQHSHEFARSIHVHSRSFRGANASDKPLKDSGELFMKQTKSSGLGEPHNNLPPYRSVIFIIKL